MSTVEIAAGTPYFDAIQCLLAEAGHRLFRLGRIDRTTPHLLYPHRDDRDWVKEARDLAMAIGKRLSPGVASDSFWLVDPPAAPDVAVDDDPSSRTYVATPYGTVREVPELDRPSREWIRLAEVRFEGATRRGVACNIPTGRQLEGFRLGGYEDHVLLRIEDESGENFQVIRLSKRQRKSLRKFLKDAE